ncbi:MAG TPA: alkaline phosphatase family protein [Candidatus Hydrogenedentes bacterium]|nr:alkaline phosphatase family protein [Candidatus Hydrogenedentota bacterium]HPG69488.1 alkaline phosphatase family protein [Candidatus Hydrogenedentota bacterium]
MNPYRGMLLGVVMAVVCLWGLMAAAEVKNIVVIGWDGAQRDHVKEMIARDEVPNLMALAKEGKLVDIDITNGATDTKAGWSQILTGYKAETTGVYHNGRFQPIPEGYSIFERLEKHFGAEQIDTVAIIGKKGHVDAEGPQRVPFEEWEKNEAQQQAIDRAKPGRGDMQGGEVVEENGVKLVIVPGKPWYNAKKSMDLFENGLTENDRVGARALEELDTRKDHRFFFFVHFAQPDHVGHKHGENAQEYTDGIKSDDEWTGKIVAKLKELGLYDKTLVYVTADHGFDEGKNGHRYAPWVFLGTNDPNVTRDGDRMDIAPTILKRFGLDLKTLEPALDGVPLDEPAERKVAPAECPDHMKKPIAPRPGPEARKKREPGQRPAAAQRKAAPAKRPGDAQKKAVPAKHPAKDKKRAADAPAPAPEPAAAP